MTWKNILKADWDEDFEGWLDNEPPTGLRLNELSEAMIEAYGEGGDYLILENGITEENIDTFLNHEKQEIEKELAEAKKMQENNPQEYDSFNEDEDEIEQMTEYLKALQTI